MSIILIEVFASVFCLTLVFMEYFFIPLLENRRRLRDIGNYSKIHIKSGVDEELQVNFKERILDPLVAKMSSITQKYTPVKQKDTIEKKLENAGRPFGWEAADFVAMQIAVAVTMAILVYLLCTLLFHTSLINKVIFILLGFIFGSLMLDYFLKNYTKNRQESIRSELPDVMDLLTVSIEAGLGFDAAMQRVVQKSKGPIATEFNQSLQEMRMGKTRREALKDLGHRNAVDDLSKFVEAIIQADQLGASLGNVLRSQADQMRVLRRQRVEEKAMKAPVKMLIPLVIFIFPTIFVVALAPAIIQMMAM